ncbi:Thioredoxin-like [Formosa sp. Hel1_31_208]|uniref:TlpA family protein disulfide reductase n=1 Tax=Formosa sp. Hel1_31_208 TaxID=1798225 RepID=UPI00087B7EDD|nr:TlpA disulfide reductase family protein [Formosa sp. Hel1_31_208]SDS10960.1 Thioredoxin-like [Formosa sp. Hel1_31_208]
MNKFLALIIVMVCFINCEAQPDPTSFSDAALNGVFVDSKGDAHSLQSVLETHQGKTILIDVWASWCRDCIVSLPDLNAVQNEYADVVFVFLSIDKTEKSWKKGIRKYHIKGEHYFMSDGWDSAFSEFVDLDWVPRYMVIDKEGHIALFRAVKITDPKIKEHLN